MLTCEKTITILNEIIKNKTSLNKSDKLNFKYIFITFKMMESVHDILRLSSLDNFGIILADLSQFPDIHPNANDFEEYFATSDLKVVDKKIKHLKKLFKEAKDFQKK